MNPVSLMEELKTTDCPLRRNEIALELADMKCNAAIPVLIELIKEMQHTNQIGTLIYALDDLDCADDLYDIIHIIFHGNWEASNMLLRVFKHKYHSMSPDTQSMCLQKFRQERERAEDTIEMIDDVLEHVFEEC